ncbi:YciI family protein [Subtercola sp. YIM 133946]|uniref:YciI family protein n=1 Tax=Subtercola sp. YIM 133946 TaxID=3118909 RepID=UPI002F928732
MEYMILIHEGETAETPQPGSPGFETYMADWMAYNQKLIDGGNFIGAGRLQPSLTATTLKRSSGADQLIDGPFAETKEQLGGYYLVTAADLDEALSLAAAMPIDDVTLEVRPIAFRPEAL